MSYDSLLQWLTTLDEQTMADLLRARPEASAAPVPADLSELAERLASPGAAGAAARRLTLPALQFLEAAQAVGDDQRLESIAAMLGRTARDEGVLETLETLSAMALAWRDGDAIVTVPALRQAFGPYPLGLGRPAEVLVNGRTAAELQTMARLLGRPKQRTKRDVAKDLVEWYHDPDAVRKVVAGAPTEALDLLGEAASGTPIVQVEAIYGYGYRRYGSGGADWAIEHGLLYPLDWSTAEMPREVCLAIRGDWHAPFAPVRPRPELVPVADEAVASEAAAAASATLDQVTELVRQCAQNPVVPLKTGGIGVREVRRLSKHLGAPERTVRFLLWLAVTAGLLAGTDSGLVPTPSYDDWAGSGPAERYGALATAWLELPAIPGLEERDEGRAPAPLAPDQLAGTAVAARPHLLAALAAVPHGHGFADGDSDVAKIVTWTAPLAIGSTSGPAPLLELLAEARQLGLSALGRLSPLGTGLLAENPAQLTDAAGALLRSDTATARFQADLSVIVAGTPERALADLLDGCADLENRGAASIWRITPGSVRRAMDTGISPEELTASLRAIAIGGSLPQPLEYLITDVARRHGQIRVRTAGCVLCAEDATLLDEVLAARSLRQLHLSRIAPTVVVSAEPPERTLEMLRTSGYAPVRENSAGVAIVELPDRHRAQAGRTKQGTSKANSGTGSTFGSSDATSTDLLAMAKTLLVAGPGDPSTRQLSLTAKMISQQASRLPKAETRVLAEAIDEGTPVQIIYTDVNGRTTQRVIEDIELAGHVIEAWCRLRQDNRFFVLSRIEAVSPA